MSPSEKDLAKAKIRQKQKEFAQYKQAIDKRTAEEDSKLMQRVIGKVDAFLQKYGEEEGYDVILALTENGGIAYAKDALDITDIVVKKLNKEYVRGSILQENKASEVDGSEK